MPDAGATYIVENAGARPMDREEWTNFESYVYTDFTEAVGGTISSPSARLYSYDEWHDTGSPRAWTSGFEDWTATRDGQTFGEWLAKYIDGEIST